jgi:hypothetical protein
LGEQKPNFGFFPKLGFPEITVPVRTDILVPQLNTALLDDGHNMMYAPNIMLFFMNCINSQAERH